MVADVHRRLVPCLAMLGILAVAPMPSALAAGGADGAIAARCTRIGDDDTVRPYDAALRHGFLLAFHRLFPRARSRPGEAELTREGSYRCMGGKLLACFTGANLPCRKIDLDRRNPGAAAFCRDNPDAEIVPWSRPVTTPPIPIAAATSAPS